ncbi:MAG: endolytic transglycosylase MltG [Chitinophagales bacterium]|nr:endolytic transglycosylase MltG [Chitinophagales bacterium]
MRGVIIGILLIIGLSITGVGYWLFVSPNVKAAKQLTIKIPTGSSFKDVLRILRQNHALKDELSFELVSKLKKYDRHVLPGNYVLRSNMNNRQIVNLLKFGWQTPVKLVIYNMRTKEDFAGLVGRTLELDSVTLLEKFNDQTFCENYGLDTNTILSRFIVDNYEFYWNTSLEKFVTKMEEGYNAFWNEERKGQANALNMTLAQITTLASIVEKEVIFDKEMPTVAGVYLNRIRIGMPLQADPTLVFALRDFDTRRVTQYHKDFNSPYNTYMYAGLPPGPICMPRKKSIDAVLNAQWHQYLYFCANPDMSGYSIFSKTYDDQMKVAAQYRKKLNQMNIH